MHPDGKQPDLVLLPSQRLQNEKRGQALERLAPFTKPIAKLVLESLRT